MSYDEIIKKNLLWAKIKALGRLWGEDEGYLKEFAKDVYTAYIERIDDAINCFDDLLKQAKILFPIDNRPKGVLPLPPPSEIPTWTKKKSTSTLKNS